MLIHKMRQTLTALQTYADTAEADAVTTANAYTDTTVGALTTDDVQKVQLTYTTQTQE